MKKQLNDVTNLVNENLANGFNKQHKVFTAADLWNIQRHAVRREQRRLSF